MRRLIQNDNRARNPQTQTSSSTGLSAGSRINCTLGVIARLLIWITAQWRNTGEEMKPGTTRNALGLIAVVAFLLPGAAIGQAVDPHNLLIRNVYLVGDDASTRVNILIEDNKLAVVSKDEVEPPERVTVVDGQDGYVLGRLGIGTTPSLIVLNLNPLENFEVLLDTEDFAVFALNNGELRVNLLSQVEEDVLAEEAETIGRGWQAYTPPPMAVPLSYTDTTKWNRWESSWVSGIFLAGVVLDRIRWGSQDAASEAHHGDLGVYDGGEIRGFRLGAVGTINFRRPWVYTVFGATNAFDKGFEVENQEDFTFFDYRLDIPLFRNANLSIGNQKEPISMERVMSMANISMQERTAVADAMLPSRSFGIVMSGTMADERMTWAAGGFNNWINDDGNRSPDLAALDVFRRKQPVAPRPGPAVFGREERIAFRHRTRVQQVTDFRRYRSSGRRRCDAGQPGGIVAQGTGVGWC